MLRSSALPRSRSICWKARAGLPVFSPHGLGGIAQLFGPTGGYLLAAPFAAAVAGLIYRDGKRTFLFALAGAAVGDVILLAIGTLWLGALAHTGIATLLSESVVPFLASDAAKVIAAAACAQIFASFSGARSPGVPRRPNSQTTPASPGKDIKQREHYPSVGTHADRHPRNHHRAFAGLR